MDCQYREHTTFIMHRRVFGYRNIPFGLINAEATIQQMMDMIFGTQISQNIQVYIGDMISLSNVASNHIIDIQEIFDNVKKHKMRLNPAKCSFGITSRNFLGFLISQRGIQAGPSQIRAITEMPVPKNIKQVQKLKG